MKMKGQLESPQPLKKHKVKTKKAELKKKKKMKLVAKNKAKESTITLPKQAIENTMAIQPIEPIEPIETKKITSGGRQRASKHLAPMTTEEQLIAKNQIIKRLLLNEMTQGEALRELRVSVLGMKQDAYTALCGVSRKTLSEIENDKGNYTADIINKAFKPFDIRLGLVPMSKQLLAAILTN